VFVDVVVELSSLYAVSVSFNWAFIFMAVVFNCHRSDGQGRLLCGPLIGDRVMHCTSSVCLSATNSVIIVLDRPKLMARLHMSDN